jgi:hypothetical protein
MCSFPLNSSAIQLQLYHQQPVTAESHAHAVRALAPTVACQRALSHQASRRNFHCNAQFSVFMHSFEA